MSTIQTLDNGETGLSHRNKLNTNFANLNADKVETTTTVNGKALSSNVTLTTDDVAEGATNLYDQVVAILASTGIQVTGTYPNFTITNSSPDQVVALTQGTGITVSGTYPNFTITNSAPDQTVTLTQGTNITITGTYPNFTINSTGGGGGGSGDMLAATYDPAGIAQQLVGTTASQELTNKTYTDVILKGASPKNNTTVSIDSGGATTVLTSASNSQIANGGTGANTAQLPVASTMQLGQYYIFRNDGSNTNALTINSSGGNLVYSLPAGENIRVVLIKNTGTDASSWRVEEKFATDAEQIFEDQKEPMGIPDSQRYNVNISHNLATREVTINGTFFYYYKGIKYIKTAVSETVTHSASIGSKFVYYVGGTLTVSDTPWDIREVATVTIIFYNNTAATTNWAGPAAIVLEERHGITMDTATHKKIHDAIGCTVVGSGFSLNGTYSVATGTGGLVANSFGVDSGIIGDEDLETTIPTLTDNSGVGNQYPVFYKTGASGEWRWFFTNLPYLFTATNITYNQNNGGTWQQTQVTANGNYMNMYVIAVPALNDAYKFAFVQGQSVYSGAGALAAAKSESILQLDLSGFPFVEAAPVQKITFRREAAYDDNGNCRIEATQKIIGTRLSVVNSSTSPSIHNNLSGRSDTDTHPASSITNTPSGNIAATTVQAAIDELDTEKVPTSRTLTINGTTYDLSADRSWTISGGGNSPVVLFSTAGTAYYGKVFKLPAFTGTISKIMISLDTLPAGGNFEFYIAKNGTSMMSGNLTITTTETVSNLLYTVKTGDSGKSTMTTTAVSDEDRIEGFIVAGSGNTFLGAGVTVSALMTAS